MKTKKRYFVLRKRLHELESDISSFVSQTPTPPYQKQAIIKTLRHKLGFLSALLSAEFASNPDRSHHRLHHIARRLSELETAFHSSLHLNFLELPDHHAGDNDNDNESTCSCTESCFDEEGYDDDDVTGSLPEEGGSLVCDGRDLNDFLCGDEHYNKERTTMEAVRDDVHVEGDGDDEKEEVEERDFSNNNGKCWFKILYRKLVIFVVSAVIIIGVLNLMVSFSRFHIGDVGGGDFVLIPT